MKRNATFILPFLLLFTFKCAHSQNCDYKVNEKDEFTGSTSLLTVSEIVNNAGKYIYLELLRTDGKYFLTMNYTESALKMNAWYCTPDDPLIFMFSDGTTLNLQPKENCYTQKTRMDRWAAAFIGGLSVFGDKYIFAPQYHIDLSELKLLSEKDVTKFRITARGKSGNTLEKMENIEFDIQEKQAVLIKKDSKCIIQDDVSSNTTKVPEKLPMNETTKKVTFEEVIDIQGISKDVLYERAKNWIIKFTKNTEFITDDKLNGEITKKGSFSKMFGRESNEFIFVLTIQFKDNKYKYTLTDIIISDGRTSMELENALEAYKQRTALIKDVHQKTIEGAMDAINSLKTAIAKDIQKGDSGW